ncbi:MAG: tyrosine-type recombinase/integrase [Truepera sp.]|nr:tyrosine-type recombinase/integrase [Truepera sp.]
MNDPTSPSLLATNTQTDPKSPTLLAIPAAALELVEGSVSPGTRRVYSSVWSRFDESGIEANDAGESGPVGPLSERVLAGFRRSATDRGCGQVTGIRHDEARSVARQAAKGGLVGLRDAALILVASDALLRVSGVAALEASDLDWASSTVTVRRSKTDQEGKGAVLYLGKPTLKRIRKWLEASKLEGGALFRRARGSGTVGESALSHQAIRVIIKSRADRASGHSLRVGSAQSLAAAGASLVEMQQAAWWGPPTMPGHYARAELASRGAVARLRYEG